MPAWIPIFGHNAIHNNASESGWVLNAATHAFLRRVFTVGLRSVSSPRAVVRLPVSGGRAHRRGAAGSPPPAISEARGATSGARARPTCQSSACGFRGQPVRTIAESRPGTNRSLVSIIRHLGGKCAETFRFLRGCKRADLKHFWAVMSFHSVKLANRVVAHSVFAQVIK
jgi:hypothetical protein